MKEIRAKKSLGQNFLHDESVIEHILEVADISRADHVFEIGPGTGMLTEQLAKRAGKVLAIELDHRMVERLEQIFELSQHVSIIENNILDVNLGEILEHSGFVHHEYKIVANIPYYITAPIVRTLLALLIQPQSLTLMVQKEVAERMTATPGAMSLLSLMVQYYSAAEIAFTVPKEAFEPVPKVESAVIHLVPRRVYNEEDDRKIFRLARAGFSARRKTLANNLSSSLSLSKEEVEEKLARLNLRLDIRAQALSVSDWEGLGEIF